MIFREGGVGRVFKTPTYWAKGTVVSVSNERQVTGRCAVIDKPVQSYSRQDWMRVVASMPCVAANEEVRVVTMMRVRVSIDDWETPWANLHGNAGWLFQGQFLDQPLKRGAVINMDAAWLSRCDS